MNWSWMANDIHEVVSKCTICHEAKFTFHQGLYTPLPALNSPWEDVCMDFILGLPRAQRGYDLIIVVVEQLSKMVHFIPCHKSDNAFHSDHLYFKEDIKLYGMPRSIVSNRDIKFLSRFGDVYQDS